MFRLGDELAILSIKLFSKSIYGSDFIDEMFSISDPADYFKDLWMCILCDPLSAFASSYLNCLVL